MSVLVTVGDRTDWLDPLRWGILTRVARSPGDRVAQIMESDSLVEEHALRELADAGWLSIRNETVEQPLAGPNVRLTSVGEEAVASGRAWIKSIGTSKGGEVNARNRAVDWTREDIAFSPPIDTESPLDRYHSDVQYVLEALGMHRDDVIRETNRPEIVGFIQVKFNERVPSQQTAQVLYQREGGRTGRAKKPRTRRSNRAASPPPLAGVLAGTGLSPRRRRFQPTAYYTAVTVDAGGTARMAYQGPSLMDARQRAQAAADQWRMPVTVVDDRWNEIKTYQPDEGAPDTVRDRAGDRARPLSEKHRREVEALRMVEAGTDLLEGAPVRFEWEKKNGTMWVIVTLYDGREKTEMVKWDERGPYIYHAGGKWRWTEGGTRGTKGILVPERTEGRW